MHQGVSFLRKEIGMLTRTNLLAMAMLGLGTLLGYAAAGGKLPFATQARAAPPAAGPTCNGAGGDCGKVPGGRECFTGAGGTGGGGGEWQTPKPGNPRGATTGPTDAPGHDHPNQFIGRPYTEVAPNMEPVIVHKKQLAEAIEKLAKAKEKLGQTPNFLVFIMDDVGWVDY